MNSVVTKANRQTISGSALLLPLFLIVSAFCTCASSSHASGRPSHLCQESEANMVGGLMGAPKEVKAAENSVEIDEIANFAVSEHNTQQGKNLTLKKVVSAQKQVVSGTMYHLKLEVHESDQPKLFEAKVWTKPWENKKTLEHFKEADSSSSVSSDTQEASGLRDISVEDPVIKEAAEHAIKGLNNKSNSLVPYELKAILSAQAEATDEETQVQLHMKVSKGTNEEDVKAGLHRTVEGKWTVRSSSV